LLDVEVAPGSGSQEHIARSIAVADNAAHELGILAKPVIAVALLLIVGGIPWHGITDCDQVTPQ